MSVAHAAKNTGAIFLAGYYSAFSNQEFKNYFLKCFHNDEALNHALQSAMSSPHYDEYWFNSQIQMEIEKAMADCGQLHLLLEAYVQHRSRPFKEWFLAGDYKIYQGMLHTYYTMSQKEWNMGHYFAAGKLQGEIDKYNEALVAGLSQHMRETETGLAEQIDAQAPAKYLLGWMVAHKDVEDEKWLGEVWGCIEPTQELTAVFGGMNEYMLGMFNNGYLRLKEAMPFYRDSLSKCPEVYDELERLFRITDQTAKSHNFLEVVQKAYDQHIQKFIGEDWYITAWNKGEYFKLGKQSGTINRAFIWAANQLNPGKFTHGIQDIKSPIDRAFAEFVSGMLFGLTGDAQIAFTLKCFEANARMSEDLNLPAEEYLQYQQFNELLGIYKFTLMKCDWDKSHLTNPFQKMDLISEKSKIPDDHVSEYLSHIELWKSHWIDKDYFGAGYWLSQNYKMIFESAKHEQQAHQLLQ